MKKLSKREKEKLKNKIENKQTTWFTFIFGASFFFGGLYKFLYKSPTITMSLRTKHPIMSDGSYMIFIGAIMLIIWVYRFFFFKNH